MSENNACDTGTPDVPCKGCPDCGPASTKRTPDAIAARLKAIVTPGPWKAWDRGIGYEVHGAYDEPINMSHRETFMKADAEFIASAPADVAYLLDLTRKQAAALEWVEALHRPVKKWEPYEGAGYSFNTRDEALEAGGEEDLGVVAIEAGPQFFEVCAECSRVESEQLSETGEEWGYRESLWPCPTIKAIEATS